AGVVWRPPPASALFPYAALVRSTPQTQSFQKKQYGKLVTRGSDGLVILCTESAPLTPIGKQAHEKGILLVTVDRGFIEPVADIFLEGDNAAFGRKSAEFMVEKLGGKGNIVILEGVPSTVNTARVDAAKEIFAMHPDIKIVGQDSGKWNRAESLKVMQTMLVKAPKIDAVWASDDDMALGAEQAIVEAGREQEMWILGGAGMKDIVARVMENDPMFPADI
ncbi:MAG: substrate-binding domain-containing protein, partial [Phycisphaera sp.]|nr:substrate-binding domain-containing protein [Phycisphaera sp.]